MVKNFANCFLVAAPTLKDVNFTKTVVYIAGYDPKAGAVGVVINRDSRFLFSDACAQLGLKLPEIFSDFFFGWGGPVKPQVGFVLHTPEKNWEMTIYQGENVSLSTSSDIIRAISENDGPRKHYVALGCAAWGEGQLEREIAIGAWYVIPAKSRIIFDLPVEKRYEAALALVDARDVKSANPGFYFSDQVGHA